MNSMRNLKTVAWLVALAAALPLSEAHAQDLELHQWRPATSLRHDYITLDGGRADLDRGFEIGAWFHYANDPLVATLNEEQIGKVVTGQLALHIVGAFEVADRFRLGLDVPAYLMQSTDADDLVGADLSGGGIGDIRVVPKLELFDGRRDGGAGAALAVLVPVLLPTGDGDRLQGASFRAIPTVAFDWASAGGFGLAANVGVQIGEEVDFVNIENNDTLEWGVGVNIPLGGDTVDFLAEVDGGIPLTGGGSSEEIPLDIMGMVRAGLGDAVLGIGTGAGLNEGWGTPDFRVFGMVGYSPRAKQEEPPPPPEPPSDRDGDGYLDDVDGCPDDPEDFDGIEDLDGCPEDDVDQDTILDADDECVFEPEDHDGWQDEDGCPDPDNDLDRVLDGVDQCPGVDGDALIDVQEVYNEYLDEDGCPDALAELTETHIQINGIIYFDLDSDVIQSRSFAVVDDVVRILNENPDVTLVEVAGHTDTRATDGYNLDLSQRRTESVVEALVSRGVDRSRLQARGYGESELADLGTTEAAHQRNRRVEFRIIERETTSDEGGAE